MQFLIVLIVSLLMSAASPRDYVYIGIAGNIVVFEYKQKAIMVRVGGYIPNTDIIVYGTDNNGAVTSVGTILLQSRVEEIESYASQDRQVGDCVYWMPFEKIKIIDVKSVTYDVLFWDSDTKGKEYVRKIRVLKDELNTRGQIIECPEGLHL